MNVLVLKGEEANLEKETVLPGDITAPVAGGEKVGELIVRQNGEILGIVDLVAGETVNKAGILLMLKRVLLDWITPAEQL
jgi:D-alanyl-D-alanine carboxypeptidase (penicillin-binding protein 5/6)